MVRAADHVLGGQTQCPGSSSHSAGDLPVTGGRGVLVHHRHLVAHLSHRIIGYVAERIRLRHIKTYDMDDRWHSSTG